MSRKISGQIFFILVLFFLWISFSRAQTTLDEADYEKLIKQHQELFKINPYDPRLKSELSILHHNYAMQLSEEGEWLKAIDQEEAAYELAPEEEIVKTALAKLYNSYALELKDLKRFRDALSKLDRALEYAPDQPQIKKNIAAVYLNLAYNAFDNNEYENADGFLRLAKEFNPEEAYIYVLSGEIAYKKDNYILAENEWKKSLELNPSLYEVKLRLEKLKQEKDLEGSFNYQEIENFKLKFEGLEKMEMADSAAQILRNAYRDVGQDLDVYPNNIVPVIIYPDSKLQQLDYFPDWASGVYDGKIRLGEHLGENTLLMKAVLYHEYTHVLVRILGHDNVPLWLNEGLAEYQAKQFIKPEHRKERRKELLKAARKGTIFSIEELSNMDLSRLNQCSPYRLQMVYTQSESFVTYLIKRTSLYDLRTLLVYLGKGMNMYKAVKKALYVDIEVLERDWKAELIK
ncbi:MAG: hypothetical protein ABII88_07885 [Candidatus Omnitrophota bacterium]